MPSSEQLLCSDAGSASTVRLYWTAGLLMLHLLTTLNVIRKAPAGPVPILSMSSLSLIMGQFPI